MVKLGGRICCELKKIEDGVKKGEEFVVN